jgi:hypothetical protein
MPDDVYTEYALRSEHALFLKLKDGLATNNKYSTSNLVIEDKLWYITNLRHLLKVYILYDIV